MTGVAAISYVKASACGNDFLIIDLPAIEGKLVPNDLASLSKQVCDRHEGIGADGVEWLFPSSEADVQARLFNADGSEAEISGNGTRCVAAYLCSDLSRAANQLPQKNNVVTILTGAGIKHCRLIAYEKNEYEFEISMGKPEIGNERTLQIGSREVKGIPVSVGNPHFVVFVNEFAAGWQHEAEQIGRNRQFARGINVEMVKISDQSNIHARFFERGVGETQSSGTGSCASAVAAISSKRAKSPAKVHAPGGVQTVVWDDQILLHASARLICRGELFV
ncbi:MAG: diaminopimelate epimerase [Terriglobales bacterium]